MPPKTLLVVQLSKLAFLCIKLSIQKKKCNTATLAVAAGVVEMRVEVLCIELDYINDTQHGREGFHLDFAAFFAAFSFSLARRVVLVHIGLALNARCSVVRTYL